MVDAWGTLRRCFGVKNCGAPEPMSFSEVAGVRCKSYV
jgi:hypothetical protein